MANPAEAINAIEKKVNRATIPTFWLPIAVGISAKLPFSIAKTVKTANPPVISQ
jgi:hypothetical protein